MDPGVLQLIGVAVGGGIGAGVAWLTNVLSRRVRREDRLEERRRIDHERAIGAYSAMLRAAIDYRAIMTSPHEGVDLEPYAARHREVRAVVALVAEPEIAQIFDDYLKFISSAVLQAGEQREQELAIADLAYQVLVKMAKLDLERRLTGEDLGVKTLETRQAALSGEARHLLASDEEAPALKLGAADTSAKK